MIAVDRDDDDLAVAGSLQVSVKDFFIQDRNCIQPDEVLVGIELPFTQQVCALCQEIMQSGLSVCLFICLFVCVPDMSNSCLLIMLKFHKYLAHSKMIRFLDHLYARCQEDLNSFALGELEETTGMPSYYVTMDRHVSGVLRSCNYRMCALRHIRPLLTLDAAKVITHSVVLSRLENGNIVAWRVYHQPQQAASGTEHTGQGDVSSTAFCQCHGVTQTTILVANPPKNNIQGSCQYI